MKLVLEPIFAADFHDYSYGYRPKRDAKQASRAIRDDLYNRAWSVVEIDFQAYFTSIPHCKLMRLITKRIANGSLLHLIKQTLTVGAYIKGTGGTDEGRGATRLTDLPVVQQHLPESLGSPVA
jgi:RNA-directed DNA polymerase